MEDQGTGDIQGAEDRAQGAGPDPSTFDAGKISQTPDAKTDPSEGWRLRDKHPLAIRWFHWLNFPILFTMIWSGLLIYWADSAPGQDAGHFYRVGWGNKTLFRLFADWFYRPEIHGLRVVVAGDKGHPVYELNNRLAEGMGWHFFLMWLFTINGIVYVLYTVFSGEWRYLLPNRRSLAEAWQVVLHDLYIRKQPLPDRKYNGAQQIAYTGVIAMGLGSLATGVAIYKPSQLSWPTALGGYEAARFLHFWLMMGFVAFFLIHVIQVVRAGWNNFRAMVTGKDLVPVASPQSHRGDHGEAAEDSPQSLQGDADPRSSPESIEVPT